MPSVTRQANITREQVRNNRDIIFVFGDNMQRRGYSGQAKAMRGEPNAIGVPTKWSPSMSEAAFFSNNDFLWVKPSIDAAFAWIKREFARGKNVIIPAIGEGYAELPKRAPKIYQYIQEQIACIEAQKNPTTEMLAETLPKR